MILQRSYVMCLIREFGFSPVMIYAGSAASSFFFNLSPPLLRREETYGHDPPLGCLLILLSPCTQHAWCSAAGRAADVPGSGDSSQLCPERCLPSRGVHPACSPQLLAGTAPSLILSEQPWAARAFDRNGSVPIQWAWLVCFFACFWMLLFSVWCWTVCIMLHLSISAGPGAELHCSTHLPVILQIHTHPQHLLLAHGLLSIPKDQIQKPYRKLPSLL